MPLNSGGWETGLRVMGAGTGGVGGAVGGGAASPGGAVGYYPGMRTPNLPPNSQDALTQAQQAVTGLKSATPGGSQTAQSPDYSTGGAGSSYDVDTTGKVASHVTPNLLPQQADLQKQQTQLEGQIAAEAAGKGNEYTQSQAAQREALGEKAFGSQFSTLQPYLSGGTNGSGHVTMGGPSAQMSPAEQAARAAAFGRAKDQAGQTAVAGLKSLQDEMASRGIQGSTIEQQGIGSQIAGAAGGVNNFTREQLINDLNRYAGIADETYQGDITQRGQDLQSKQALIGLLGKGISY